MTSFPSRNIGRWYPRFVRASSEPSSAVVPTQPLTSQGVPPARIEADPVQITKLRSSFWSGVGSLYRWISCPSRSVAVHVQRDPRQPNRPHSAPEGRATNTKASPRSMTGLQGSTMIAVKRESVCCKKAPARPPAGSARPKNHAPAVWADHTARRRHHHSRASFVQSGAPRCERVTAAHPPRKPPRRRSWCRSPIHTAHDAAGLHGLGQEHGIRFARQSIHSALNS